MTSYFERVNVFFSGIIWSEANILILDNGNEQYLDYTSESVEQAQNKTTIIGIESISDDVNSEKIIETIRKSSMLNSCRYYFIVKRNKDVRVIENIIREFSLGKSELYGIDPDYYYSFVPLNTSNSKSIEHYVLNQKSNFSLQDSMKHMIKKCLINLRLSYLLYECFVIIAIPTTEEEC